MRERIPTLTKKDIAKEVALQGQVRLIDAELQVENVLSAIKNLLMTADPEVRLEVRDFGVFEVKLTKAKPLARNPKTGKIIFVPPHRKTHFKPGKAFKAFLLKPISISDESPYLPEGGALSFHSYDGEEADLFDQD